MQGRVVSFQGCAADAALAPALEAWAGGLPQVQQAVAALRTDPAARPPYRVREASPGAGGAERLPSVAKVVADPVHPGLAPRSDKRGCGSVRSALTSAAAGGP